MNLLELILIQLKREVTLLTTTPFKQIQDSNKKELPISVELKQEETVDQPRLLNLQTNTPLIRI